MKKVIITLLILSQYIICIEQGIYPDLYIPVSSRAISLGGAYTAVADDINGIYYNPAGLSFIKYPELIFSHQLMGLDIHRNVLGIGKGFKNISSGIMISGINTSDEERNLGGQIYTSKITYYNYSIAASNSMKINKNLAVGLNIRYNIEKIYTYSRKDFSLDIGTIFVSPDTNIRLGVAFKNFGLKSKLQDKDGNSSQYSDNLPWQLNTGIMVKIPMINTLVAGDVSYNMTNGNLVFCGGLEFNVFKIFFINWGYQYSDAVNSGQRVGLGVRQKYADIRYSFYKLGELGYRHCFEFRWRFLPEDYFAKDAEVIINSSGPAAERVLTETDLDEIKTNFDKGLQYYKNKEYVSAVNTFRKIIKPDPNNYKAHYYIGLCYDRLENYDLAEYYYSQSIKHNPDYILSLTNLAIIYFKQNKLEKSEKLVDRVLVLEPNNKYAVKVKKMILRKYAK